MLLLEVCQTIVKRNHGSMRISSTLGKGTTIKIELPLEFIDPIDPASPPANTTAPLKRRVLSQELETLYQSSDRVRPSVRRVLSSRSERGRPILGTQLDGPDLEEELEKLRTASSPTRPMRSEQEFSVDIGSPARVSVAPRVHVLVAEDNHIAR